MPGDVPFIFRCVRCNDRVYIYESSLPPDDEEILCYECKQADKLLLEKGDNNEDS